MASPSTGAAEPTPSSARAAARIALLLLWLLLCVPPHLAGRVVGRSRWPRRFLAGAARILGADVRVTGAPLAPGALLIANHISWLDIPVLAAATGCRFVSKDELRAQPLLHWLADQNDTLYIRRSDRRGIGDQAGAIAAALHKDQPLALFPEGTTGDGRTLLPFRAPLFSAVTPPPPGVSLRPVAIDYGAAAPEIGWSHGEPGKANALRLLGRKGRIGVTVRLLDPLAPSDDRKLLARSAQEAIAAALAPSAPRPSAL